MRQSVRALIRQGGRILLIRRTRNGDTYYVLPGGGIENADSSPEAALERELLEELSVRASVGHKLFGFIDTHQGVETQHTIFDCTIPHANVSLGVGPESLATSEQNKYELIWIESSKLADLDVRPAQLGNWMKEGGVS